MRLRSTIIFAIIASVSAFVSKQPFLRKSRFAIEALTCPAVAEGEREIVDGSDGSVLVTKVAGGYYAVDAKCPHLGLPMKRGKISNEDGTPTITCRFHNSCFELESGKCTRWVTGALGIQSGFVSKIMGKVGSDKKDIRAYTVTEQEDGSLLIE